jgi:hypothetical protein
MGVAGAPRGAPPPPAPAPALRAPRPAPPPAAAHPPPLTCRRRRRRRGAGYLAPVECNKFFSYGAPQIPGLAPHFLFARR